MDNQKNLEKLSVYVDLDDTMIRNLEVTSKDRYDFSHNDEYFQCYRNPFVEGLLYLLRTSGFRSVKMLTFGQREYALKTNEVAFLGFDPEDIIAREDYVFPQYESHGSIYWTPLAYGMDKDSILIDDFEPSHKFPTFKREFLGIEIDKHYHYTPFELFGEKDHEQWKNDVVQKSQKLVSYLCNLSV